MPAKTWPLFFWKRIWWQQWFRVSKTTLNIATLHPRQIYILPTRWGILYGVMLIALLIGSINYALSLGFYITFLLAALGNIAMLHTWRNLLHLQVSVIKVSPVFAGDFAEVTLQISDLKNRPRYAVCACFSQDKTVTQNIAVNEAQVFSVPVSTQKRGLHALPRITLNTQFPLNLLHAWAVVENPFQVLVYPKASDFISPKTLSSDVSAQTGNQLNKGDEDFNGHKNYQFGDSPSRIDWKASSRSIGMFTKLYSGTVSSTLWLDWDLTEGDYEARISQLTRWVIEAHAAQQNYGLKLPSITLQPSHSESHYHQALTALALLD
ncbi:MAG: DUF58 domain-containing protein [Pseudomonadota bacterium]